MEKSSKIYIAGHNGLVGSAIAQNLKQKGYNNIIGKDIRELDLRDSDAVNAYFQKENPEYVFLAAAKVGGIMANNTYRAEFIFDNLMIQNNVIHNSYLHGVKKLLFLGSTCIYPGQCPQPMKEEYLLTGELEYTNEPYAIAKIGGIKMCESYNIQYGTNFLSVMPTNLYGPNDNFDLEKSHVLPAMLRKIYLAKCMEADNFDEIRKDLVLEPIENVDGNSAIEEIIFILEKYGIKKNNNVISVEIWGSGEPLREFLWSEEMADACVFIMEKVNFSDVAGSSGEIRNTHINIGTGREISIKNLAYLVKETIGFTGELFFNKEKPDGTVRKLTDTKKLNALGWKHKIEIEQGVIMMYDWYRGRHLIKQADH
ncbi:MAG: GDP-L-fucose synthase [Bacteroidales bacterium]|jgi:GDP-L-fucose synthase|nr:GDP-L-fucose synthase [Bacteroidales bacterium]MDD4214153.1 GDP-L-fucose synthase [Bacteroidales bacterium]